MRLRWKEIEAGRAELNPETLKLLEVKPGVDFIEVVVKKKLKHKAKAYANKEVPPNECWCNYEELKAAGLADNSIATVRKAREDES